MAKILASELILKLLFALDLGPCLRILADLGLQIDLRLLLFALLQSLFVVVSGTDGAIVDPGIFFFLGELKTLPQLLHLLLRF